MIAERASGRSRAMPAPSRWHPSNAYERRLVRTLAAYVVEGSHKAAAHRLDVSESTCRQRVSQLMRLVDARTSAEAVWLLREQLR